MVGLGQLFSPKSEGGLGFRNIYAFNLVMLAKHAWRIIKNPDSLLTRVLKVKYFPTTSFLDAVVKPNCSFNWRSLCAAWEVIKRGLSWMIGNDASINIWRDPWIPLPSNFRILSSKLNGCTLENVHNLVDHASIRWRVNLIESIFSNTETELIRSIPLSVTGKEDFLI